VAAQERAWCSDAETVMTYKWTASAQVRAPFLRALCLALLGEGAPEAPVIWVHGAWFTGGDVDLSNLSRSMTLRLHSCKFDGSIDLHASQFMAVELDNSMALGVSGLGIKLDADLSLESFTCGQLHFEDSKIEGKVNCVNANTVVMHFTDAKGKDQETEGRTSFDHARVKGTVDLTSGTFSQGVSLVGATVGGDLDCSGCTIHPCTNAQDSHFGQGVTFEDVQVGESITLDGATVSGESDLTGARIGGDFSCKGTHLYGNGGLSLNMEKVVIDGAAIIQGEFSADGQVLINNAAIKNGIQASGGSVTFSNSSQPPAPAVFIASSTVQGTSDFGESVRCAGLTILSSRFGDLYILANIGGTGLDLENTKTAVYTDMWSARQPASLNLKGFTYLSIADQSPQKSGDKKAGEINVETRLQWLQLGAGKSSQPYVQLANVLREQGRDDAATQVLEQLAGATLATDNPLVRVKDDLLGRDLVPFNYGYEPINAFYFMLALTGIGWIVYRRNAVGGIVPTEKEAFQCVASEQRVPSYYTTFSPLVYSLENTFPLVDLGQARKWQPNPYSRRAVIFPRRMLAAMARRSPKESPKRRWALSGVRVLAALGTVKWLRVFVWVQVLLGWLLATFLVAGLGGLIRK